MTITLYQFARAVGSFLGLKRKRESAAAEELGHAAHASPSRAQQLATFKQWMQLNDISCSESISLALSDDGGNCYITAREHLQSGQSLCVLPKEALLSLPNSDIQGALEEDQISGGLGLAIAVMRELMLGKQSEWCGSLLASDAVAARCMVLPCSARMRQSPSCASAQVPELT